MFKGRVLDWMGLIAGVVSIFTIWTFLLGCLYNYAFFDNLYIPAGMVPFTIYDFFVFPFGPGVIAILLVLYLVIIGLAPWLDSNKPAKWALWVRGVMIVFVVLSSLVFTYARAFSDAIAWHYIAVVERKEQKFYVVRVMEKGILVRDIEKNLNEIDNFTAQKEYRVRFLPLDKIDSIIYVQLKKRS